MRHRAWAGIAAAQAGVISTAQLRRAGIDRSRQTRMISEGLLARYLEGLYLVRSSNLDEWTRAWIAVLATDGILCGPSAAAVWGMLPALPSEITVYVSRQCRRDIPQVRQIRHLPTDRERSTHDGLPITTRGVSAIDTIALLPWAEAMPFADRAYQQRWFGLADVEARCLLRRPGNGQLRRAVGVLKVGGEFEAERLAVRLLREAGLTGFAQQFPCAGRRIDIAFVEARLAIEIDGFAYHSNRARFQADRTKHNALVDQGWLVLRFTWSDLTERPTDFLDSVRRHLTAR